MVTAKEAEFDKVRALEAGADDYITKPFGMMEFIARVKAVLRRSSRHGDDRELSCEELRIFPGRHQVYCDEQPVELTRKEFELLLYLMENRGIVMTRDQILCHIWGMILTGRPELWMYMCEPFGRSLGIRQTNRDCPRRRLQNGRQGRQSGMKKKILSHTSVMIVLTVILTFIAASFVMYDKFNSTMKKGVRDEAEYVKVGIEEVGEEYLNGNVGKTTDTRITLTDSEGNVLYDNEAEASNFQTTAAVRNLSRLWKMDREKSSVIRKPCHTRPFIMR